MPVKDRIEEFIVGLGVGTADHLHAFEVFPLRRREFRVYCVGLIVVLVQTSVADEPIGVSSHYPVRDTFDIAGEIPPYRLRDFFLHLSLAEEFTEESLVVELGDIL